MPIRVLLADADGTLFDFHKGEAIALAALFARFQLPATQAYLDIYKRVNAAQWARLERGETTQARLRLERFEDFLREAGLAGDPQAMKDYFEEQLGMQSIPLPGAEAFCRQVSARMPIYLVTNGIARVQRGRFVRCALAPYLSGLFISEEVGHAKPHPAMLLSALEACGAKPSEAMLLGDSVTADIAAARAAGVPSILFTNGQEPPHDHGADYVARDYAEALKVLGVEGA